MDSPAPDPAPSPTVSVVIPCRNEQNYIGPCLRGILTQDPVPGGFEVIVADGRSTDETRERIAGIAASDARVRCIDNPARVTPAGLNAAIREARGATIVRIDAHTEYAQDYLQQCLSFLQATGADNVGGPWVARGRSYLSRAIAAAFQSPFAVGGARGHQLDYAGPVDTVYLGCWPKHTFERFGGFDEEFVRNQDDEHNLRIVRGGGTVMQSPRIRSWYTPRSSLRMLFRQYYQYGYWKVRVIRKHRLPASVRHLVPGLFVTGLAICLIGAPFLGVCRWAGAAAAAAYGIGVLTASSATAAKAGWDLLPVLPAVFAGYHFGYGSGFMRGVLDVWVLRRAASRTVTAMTR